MPNCVSIINIDHLPNEQTILIRYVIGCSGLWDLNQTYTAYRGVCDEFWVNMYPNEQHPQHTDFPIEVTVPGFLATFAWNYGGIPGISSENFNSTRSYLTQLSLFNLDCYYTGDPTVTGSQSGVVSGNPTGGSGNPGDPIIPIIRPRPPINRPPPVDPPIRYYQQDPMDPFPGIIDPGNQPQDPSGGDPDPGDPDPGQPDPGDPGRPTPKDPSVPDPGDPDPQDPDPNDPDPQDPQDPDPWGDPVSGDPSGQTSGNGGNSGPYYEPYGGTLYDPQGWSQPDVRSSTLSPNRAVINGIQFYSQIDPNTVGVSDLTNNNPVVNGATTVTVANNQNNSVIIVNPNLSLGNYSIGTASTNSEPITASRPSGRPIGGLFLTSSIPGDNELNQSQETIQLDSPTPKRIDRNGGFEGYPTSIGNQENKSNFKISYFADPAISKVSTKYIDKNAEVIIQVPSKNVTVGSVLPISTAFVPTIGTSLIARIEIIAQDSVTSSIVANSSYKICKHNDPVTCSTTIYTGLYKPGPLLIIAKVYNNKNNVIGIKSILVSNQEANQYDSSTKTNRTTIGKSSSSFELPTQILQYSSNPLQAIDLKLDLTSSKYLILRKVGGSNNLFSLVFKTNNIQDPFEITVYSYDATTVIPFVPKYPVPYFEKETRILINDKIKINTAPLYPELHNIGVLNANLSDQEVLLKITPINDYTNKRVEGKLYISNNYAFPSTIAVVTTSYILATTSFVEEEVGLVVYGPVDGYLKKDYVMYKATTSRSGAVYFYDTSIQKGDYFAIFAKSNGTLSPFVNKIYSGKY